jgi:hypothetical protein
MKINWKWFPLFGLLFNDEIISLFVLCFYAVLFVVFLFKNMPKNY